MPEYSLMSEEDKLEEEAYFDPLILDISLKKTIADAFLQLGDTYNSVWSACEGLEMLGIDRVCFYGAFKPREFKKILSKFRLLHAECLTKLISVLAKAHVKACDYDGASNLLKIEHFALKAYPISFIQVLSHMETLYRFNYLTNKIKNLSDLETNIYSLCIDRLSNFDKLIDLTEIIVIGNTYATLVEINFALAQYDRSTKAASGAIRILELNNCRDSLPQIRIILSHMYFHLKDYENCTRINFELLKMSTVTSSRKYRALSICCLSMFLTVSVIGIQKTEIPLTYDKCNTFATNWGNESSRILPEEIIFYVSVVMTRWCLYSDENTGWIGGKNVFSKCYELAKTYQQIISRSNFDYWTISGLMLLLQIEIRLSKKMPEDISVDKELIHKELAYLKDKMKTHYPVYLEEYKQLVTEAEKLE